ncbi:heavy-metal-associated domain-containing protein [Cohnella silvisoli]|uniref:Heavy metal-associated domain-containing protein n=1 Tax=Cohnella silvisoli TaxID=2873699 RepID=A0ABV1KUS6_9BACL|nr:heavy metal-associated domain-containing protein [Cohnella silvisoli]MCD9021469.1 cation transporter [Cohnella silvisoli]
MQEATVNVQGMFCRSCIHAIEGALESIGAEGRVNFEQGTVHVQYNEAKVQLADIKEAIQNKGYNVVA